MAIPPREPLELRIPRRLESPNQSRGAHWRVRHRIAQEWEQEIAIEAVRRGAGLWITRQPPAGKMRVEVERHLPSLRNAIRDDDNLRFAVKPLLDALKRQYLIRGDSRKWLDHPTPTQHVSPDGKDYTVIRIAPVAEVVS